MRLLILNWRDLAHPRAGGSEVYAQRLARAWSSSGHHVVYFCAAVNGKPSDEAFDGYRVIRRGGRLGVYREARNFVASRRTDFDAILDVVNTRPFLTPRYANGLSIVALIYQTAEDVWKYELPAPLAFIGRRFLEPRWLKTYRNILVLTISTSSRESLERFGLMRVQTVPVGMDNVVLRQLPDRERNLTALFVGRLTANKRPEAAIAAFALARKQLPNAHLWVVGDGPLAHKLQRSSPPGTFFFGRVTEQEKWNLMARSHVLLATSVREGWGMTVTEAASVGTRTLAYDVPGLRDSVSAAGGRLTASSTRALAEGLVKWGPAWMDAGPLPAQPLGALPWNEVATQVLNALTLGVSI